jgi:magnesium transporter
MTEVMKVLAIFSAIFMPLTFVAGIYGMNFEFMPELNLKYGYPLSLLVMAIIAFGLIRYIKFKNWM